MYFFIVVLFFLFCCFDISMLRCFEVLLFGSLANGKFALSAHLSILIHDAVDATVFHGLTVVNMLRREGAILARKYFHQEKKHAYSNY